MQYFWQGNHKTYGVYTQLWPTLHIYAPYMTIHSALSLTKTHTHTHTEYVWFWPNVGFHPVPLLGQIRSIRENKQTAAHVTLKRSFSSAGWF